MLLSQQPYLSLLFGEPLQPNGPKHWKAVYIAGRVYMPAQGYRVAAKLLIRKRMRDLAKTFTTIEQV